KKKSNKLFQCTGYGDCNMVFTRSEHLARHARKHTGEKPFVCIIPGCGKAFSRFDNMMQHTQTHKSHSKNKSKRNKKLCESSSSEDEDEFEFESRRRRLSVADLCNPSEETVYLTKDEFEAIEALGRFQNSFHVFSNPFVHHL
ncbi:uncharacterized protein B0P05DRAFT_538121, partial [Gilbertella persicaria]|uniref:uncharacterized protein n=1 Tax=Gilbertella persicaria TaxID=101096 RepID=UPI002220F8F4